MWLCTKYGFFSIVDKGLDEFHIRARVRKDLEILRTIFASEGHHLPGIECWPHGDYRFRIITDHYHLRMLFDLLAESIDYPNFKVEIASRPDQSGKLFTYHQIWTDLASLQPPRNAAILEHNEPAMPM